ncbi:hypothetical protein ACWCP6_00405 [Streptomyces sp. NPDC002004]
MGGRGMARTAGLLLTTVLVGSTAACSGTNSPSGVASRAASAASAASSMASAAASAVGSATAEAGRRLDEFKNGVHAQGDVKLGAVTKNGDDRAAVKVTVTNSVDSAKSYAIQINFRDPNGNLLDVVVVTLDGVPAHASKDATATSNRALKGDVTASVGTALRH